MTLDEKLAQIVGYWVDQGGEVVAPMQGEMATSGAWEDVTRHGLGHVTRAYGTRPVDPAERAAWLWGEQRRLRNETRLGIPALVHEECLTGLAAWQATCFPAPPSWGAAFDTELVEEMAALIGASMRTLGIHQGLAPVLDVVQDPRWGRVEECVGEDPHLVGEVGLAYVRGLQGAGVHATLKHFVGYSASKAARNHAPVQAGPRYVADVLLPPFERAVLDGGVRSVMNSYAAVDGVPVAADPTFLTDLLRERWGFDGTVVADYFSVAFLEVMHAVAADRGEAAQLALEAGIDIELPTGDAYLAPLAERVRAGLVDEAWVDRAVLRALAQKEELGLLDATFDDEPPTSIDLDPASHRDVARRLAEESVVLVSNDGTLPLGGPGRVAPARVAVVGPNADRVEALMGCYSFANHVLAHHPGTPLGIEMATVLEALRAEPALADADVMYVRGCEVEGAETSGIAAAAAVAAAADVAIVVVGDQAGLFGRGTVGEGNDADDLELPGVQRALVEAVCATGTPTVLVLVTGRPYAVGPFLDVDGAVAAVVQTFFPGEEGAGAVAGVLAGRAVPSGRLPVSLPRSAGAQPYTYLQPLLGGPNEVTSADPTPARPFGHGLSYTTFTRTLALEAADVPTSGVVRARVRVTNTGERDADDVVQLYGHDVLATVNRPTAQLLAFRRVHVPAGTSVDVELDVPTTRLAFSDRRLRRVVEPGRVDLWVGDCATREAEATLTLTGDVHEVRLADPR
ncbi:glycoside hydrolase family 3 N-terminal domain-containing protein [Sanguibacter sp. HDW7]|uniref:beta-xylosidase/alpha-l-arabinosidase n=1 Tax=Sanguibacter sp. HDW7 TaxID=2714931 RepID=UPI001F0FFE28|nr:glycoside hydrolase family 3 N-terminal domain-containing protein [Sanguibacter sp. HDW7]